MLVGFVQGHQRAAALSVKWLNDTEAVLATIRSLEFPAGEGYAWCAAEATAISAVRSVLVEERGHDCHAIRAAAYWKCGAIAHHENLDD